MILSARDYEWRAALQFTLLTFPSNPIFGIGADTDAKKHTEPQTYMFGWVKSKRCNRLEKIAKLMI